MQKWQRIAHIDAAIGEDGSFPMVMATEGEASDGHILSIAGLKVPEKIPLQVDHRIEALRQLGSVSEMRKGAVDGVPALRGVGRIRLSGEGEGLSFRTDIADAVRVGDLRATSLTWAATKAPVERRSLPKDHPAAISRTEPDPIKRFGLFFPESEAIEQSLVPVGADRLAMIGRARGASSDKARAMWQTLADGTVGLIERSRVDELLGTLQDRIFELEEIERTREADKASSDDLPPAMNDLEALFARAGVDLRSEAQAATAELETSLDDIFFQLTGRSRP